MISLSIDIYLLHLTNHLPALPYLVITVTIHSFFFLAWVVPGTYTSHNYACYEDGSNCVHKKVYVDPSNYLVAMKRRLVDDNQQNNNHNIGNSIRG